MSAAVGLDGFGGGGLSEMEADLSSVAESRTFYNKY